MPTSKEMADLIDSQRALAVDFQNAAADQNNKIEGKTLLVTGGASGFGETFVTTFAENPGCATIIADFDKIKGEDLEKTLQAWGRTFGTLHLPLLSLNLLNRGQQEMYHMHGYSKPTSLF